LVDWFVNHPLAWLLKHLFGVNLGRTTAGFGGSWIAYAALVLLSAAVLVAVVIAARAGVFKRLRSPRDLPGVVVNEIGVTLAPEAWYREAERLAAQGRYREALRCRYRALVAEMAERRLLEEIPGRTTGDYERLVCALLPDVAPAFSVLTRAFERCWYGQQAADATGQAQFAGTAEAIVKRLEASRGRGRPASATSAADAVAAQR
jgi:hypothetical protein